MRQLIARIDDDLHAQLKERARSEGRSLNALVTELLAAGVNSYDQRRALRERVRAAGLLYVPPKPKGPVLSLDEIEELYRGTGTAVSEALAAERKAR